ncbi:MAG: hypothetical protein JXA18_13590 [Chitinispirillaceae bacterium]|nr:hypothetical protein [Chitinispirillaceae bacterium]
MRQWTLSSLASAVERFDMLPNDRQHAVLQLMNRSYPPSLYEEHRKKRRRALAHANSARTSAAGAIQQFPPFIPSNDLQATPDALRGYAVVFTAGGEGERLKTSLLKRGVSPASLHDFTKATYGLPGIPNRFGTLQTNLAMIASLCRESGVTLPVIVTTGPAGSTTATVISELAVRYRNFGLKHLLVIPQEERLFLSNDERIVLQEADGVLTPITHPDETGGPLMKLKKPGVMPEGASVLEWLEGLGCRRTIVVQATALYDQKLLPLIASALGTHDCLGVGILRDAFPANDPYGTFVSLRTDDRNVTMILEQDMRNDRTRSITDPTGRFFLPYNTGLYAFQNRLLLDNDLPDFATPPKELRPDLARAPKIGYAAIDAITLAKDPIILTIDPSLFGVLKNADDLERLAALGKKFGLDRLCADFGG